jgi:carbamoyl-phosphate synthase large subunit
MVKRILITGAGGPAGVNFTKSLKIAPEKMFLVGTEANPYYANLALTDKVHVVPKATASNYIDKINDIIEKEKIEFIHPQPDIEVKAVSESREKINAKIFLPSKTAVRICQDKLKSAERWKKRGIAVAKTIELKNEADIKKAFSELGTPLWIRAKWGAGGKGSTPASNLETALSWINYWKSRNKDWEFIAQEYLQGRNIAFHSLWKDGELVTSMARERLQYIYPHLAPSGITGTPSVQRTIHDDKVNEVGTEAVLAIDPKFNGIACVDLKENDEGTPCVTEINAGRMFTTSFFFSYTSKKLLKNYHANFPYLYVKLAYHERVPNIPKYNILPKDLHWIRHIDAPARLVKAGKVVGAMYR